MSGEQEKETTAVRSPVYTRYKPEALAELVTAAQAVAQDYPTIAGMVIAMQNTREERAEEHWNEIARRVHALCAAVARLNRPRDMQ